MRGGQSRHCGRAGSNVLGEVRRTPGESGGVSQSEPQRPVERTATWASPARGGQAVRCSMRRSLGPWRTAAAESGRATGDMVVADGRDCSSVGL